MIQGTVVFITVQVGNVMIKPELYHICFMIPESEEPDWLFTVGVDMDYETAEILAIKHCADNWSVEPTEIHLSEIWWERITKVDGFNITVEEQS